MLLCSALYLTIKDDTTQQAMSETQIREAAEELGMIDNPVLSQLTTETDKEQKEAESTATTEEQTSEQKTDKQDQTTEQTTEQMKEQTAATEESSTDKAHGEEASGEDSATQANSSSKKEQESKTADNGRDDQNTSTSITIEVRKGEGSDTVSKKLEEAGLVSNAKEFDKYLMANGYDKKITAGTHQIPTGAEKEEIAKSLCK